MDTTEIVSESEESYGGGRRRELSVLIVEDNDDVVQYLKALLSKEYRIEVAADGEEGREKAFALVPDLILSDVMMPHLDGFELCSQLKNDIRTSHIPVVLLTARADMPSRLEGLGRGADAYLAKPFNRDELFVQIRNLMDQRKALQAHFTSQSDALSEKHALPPQEDAFFRKVRHTLSQHLGEEDFGIDELCRALGMSRSQLYRKFHALTNITVHHYIRDMRLRKAYELLHTGNMTVTEVALETGFKNLSHFSRVFSSAFGISPSELNGHVG